MFLLCLHGFSPPTVQRRADRLTGESKSPLGVNVCVSGCSFLCAQWRTGNCPGYTPPWPCTDKQLQIMDGCSALLVSVSEDVCGCLWMCVYGVVFNAQASVLHYFSAVVMVTNLLSGQVLKQKIWAEHCTQCQSRSCATMCTADNTAILAWRDYKQNTHPWYTPTGIFTYFGWLHQDVFTNNPKAKSIC